MSALKVFLVEDSPVIRQNLVAALEDLAPVEVVGHADTAADAVSRLQAQRPSCDLAIIDVFLSQGSGLDVLRDLQSGESPVRRVVLTNYATPEMRAQCLRLGADRVFDKSGDIDALIDYCTGVAGQRAGDAA
jgi:DNA-binding NarL/FixJ family response regulator